MKVAFSVFDRNEDGKISKEELAVVLKEAEVVFTDEQLNDFMERVDKDGEYIFSDYSVNHGQLRHDWFHSCDHKISHRHPQTAPFKNSYNLTLSHWGSSLALWSQYPPAGYPPVLTWPLPGYTPPAGYPPHPDLARAGSDRVPPSVCPMAFWEMLQSIMGYGYPPLWTDRWKDRRMSKHYLPIVLRTRAVINLIQNKMPFNLLWIHHKSGTLTFDGSQQHVQCSPVVACVLSLISPKQKGEQKWILHEQNFGSLWGSSSEMYSNCHRIIINS